MGREGGESESEMDGIPPNTSRVYLELVVEQFLGWVGFQSGGTEGPNSTPG